MRNVFHLGIPKIIQNDVYLRYIYTILNLLDFYYIILPISYFFYSHKISIIILKFVTNIRNFICFNLLLFEINTKYGYCNPIMNKHDVITI